MIRASWSLSPTSIYCPLGMGMGRTPGKQSTTSYASVLLVNCLPMTFRFSAGAFVLAFVFAGSNAPAFDPRSQRSHLLLAVTGADYKLSDYQLLISLRRV